MQLIARTLIVAPDGDILFLRRSSHDKHRPGGWDFPGGYVEPGEDPFDAARREAFEETGVSPAHPIVVYGASGDHSGAPFCRIVYIEYIQAKPQVKLSIEHDSYAWMSADAMLAQTDHAWHRELLEYLRDQRLFNPEVGQTLSTTCRTLITNQNGDILMVRRSPTDRFKPGEWDIPGGGAKDGESLTQAAVREAHEEVNIMPVALRPVFAITAPRSKGSRTWVFFASTTIDSPVLGDEHDKLQWIPLADLPRYTDYDILRSMQAFVLAHQLL